MDPIEVSGTRGTGGGEEEEEGRVGRRREYDLITVASVDIIHLCCSETSNRVIGLQRPRSSVHPTTLVQSLDASCFPSYPLYTTLLSLKVDH
jgi:hypothetical protein